RSSGAARLMDKPIDSLGTPSGLTGTPSGLTGTPSGVQGTTNGLQGITSGRGTSRGVALIFAAKPGASGAGSTLQVVPACGGPGLAKKRDEVGAAIRGCSSAR